MPYSGQEDITFSMGLTGLGIESSLAQTERNVKASLGRIGASFKELRKAVDATGSSNPLGTTFSDLNRRAANLNAQFREMRKNVTELNAVMSKTPAGSMMVARELQSVVRMQQEVTKLKSMLASGSGRPMGDALTDNLNKTIAAANKVTQLLKFPEAAKHANVVANVLKSIHLNLSELNKNPLSLDTRLAEAKLVKLRAEINSLWAKANAGPASPAAAAPRAVRENLPRDTAQMLKGSGTLLNMLQGPSRSVGLSLVANQLTQIDALLSRLNAKPLTVETAKARADLEAVRAKIVQTANQYSQLGAKGNTALSNMKFRGETLNQEFQKAGGILRNISTLLSTIGLGGGIFALIYAFKKLVADGIAFNAEVERAKISMGAVIGATAEKVELDGKQLKGLAAILAVQGNVNVLVRQLRADALQVNGTFEDLLGIAQSVAPQVLRMGGNMDTIHKLTRLTGIAASVLGVSFKEASTGITQMLNGTVLIRNTFTKRLPVDSIAAFRKELQNSTDRAGVLIKVMSRLESAGPLLLTSFKGASESVKDIVQQLSAQAFTPLQKRLQDFYNSVVSGKLVKMPDGSVKWSKDLEATITRVSKLVDRVLTQVVVLFGQLSRTGKTSFLTAAEEALPKVIDFVFMLMGVFKRLSDFMMSHSAIVLKLLGYYLGFNMLVGSLNSIRKAFTNILSIGDRVFGMFQNLSGSMKAAKVDADGVTIAGGRASAVLASLGAALKGFAISTGIVAVIFAVVELGRGLMASRKDARDLSEALSDINEVKFDGAMQQLSRLREALKNTGMWNSLKRGHTSQGALKEDVAGLYSIPKAAQGRLHQAAGALGIPLDTLGRDSQAAELAGKVFIQSKQKLQDLQVEYQGASAARKQAIDIEVAAMLKHQNAAEGMLNILEELGDALPVAKSAVSTFEKDPAAWKGSEIGKLYGFEQATRGVAKVRAMISNMAAAKFTPSREPEVEDDPSRRISQYENRIINALEQQAQAQARIVDRRAANQVSELENLGAQHLLTLREQGENEIAIAKQTADAKIAIQQELFAAIASVRDKDMAKVGKTLGLDKALSFESLRALPEDAFDKAIVGFEKSTSKETDEKKIAENSSFIELLRNIAKVQSTLILEEEKRAGAITETNSRILKAEDARGKFLTDQNEQLKNRNAAVEVEGEQAVNFAATLDERIQREQWLNGLLIKRRDIELDSQATKQKNEIDLSDATPAEKSNLKASVDATTASEKALFRQQQALALTESTNAIRQSEIDLAERSTQEYEIQLQTMTKFLGSENVLVVAMQKKLDLAKAHTLELQAQEKFAEAAQWMKTDVTKAREAEKEGKILQATAQALRKESTNYLQAVGSGLAQLSGLLGAFSAGLGGAVLSVAKIVSSMGAVQGSGGIAALFRAGSGMFQKDASGATTNVMKSGLGIVSKIGGSAKGAMAAAGPYMAAAGAAIDMFATFVSIFSAGAKKVVKEAADTFNASIATISDDLRRGRIGVAQTVAELEAKKANVGNEITRAKVNGVANFFTLGFSQRSVDNDRKKAIEDAVKAIDEQLVQLQRDSEDAIRNLDTLLGQLHVQPAQREFQQQLADIRKELDALAQTPGITQAKLNDLFSLRLGDMERDIRSKIADEQSGYLDLLKQEKDVKQQLLDLDKEKSSVQDDYKKAYAELVGLSTRQLSKAEQLAALKKDRDEKLSAIETQRTELQNQLAFVEKQKEIYAGYKDQFGLVDDIATLQLTTEDTLLTKTKERIKALSDFYGELEFKVASGLDSLLTAPIWQPTVPSPGSYSKGSILYNFNGDINIDGDLTQSEVRDSVVEALRMLEQQNTTRGLAFSNA